MAVGGPAQPSISAPEVLLLPDRASGQRRIRALRNSFRHTRFRGSKRWPRRVREHYRSRSSSALWAAIRRHCRARSRALFSCIASPHRPCWERMGAWLVGETAGRPFPLPVLGRLSRAQSRMAAPSPFRREPSSIFRRLSEPSHFVPSCRGTAAASSTESGAGEPRIRAGALPFVGLRSLVATDWRRVSDRSFSLFIAPNRAASSAAVGNGIGF